MLTADGTRRLTLHRERLAELSADELAGVAGAAATDTCTTVLPASLVRVCSVQYHCGESRACTSDC